MNIATADRISMWDPEGQVFRRFYLLDHINPQFNRKWVDTSVVPNIIATNDLVTGEGFWYERNTTNRFEWVEVRPYAIP